MLMEYAIGDTLLSRALRPTPMFFRAPGIIANTLADLHGLDPDPLRLEFTTAGLDPDALDLHHKLASARAMLPDRSVAAGLRQVGDWLEAQSPSAEIRDRAVVCHGDFHPLNILVDGDRVSAVIDWSNVGVAPAEYDLAISNVIVQHGPVELLGPIRRVIDLVRGYWVRKFNAAYRARRSVDEDLVRYYEVHRCFLAATHAAFAEFESYAWGEPHTYQRLGRLMQKHTGIDPALPTLPA